MCVCFFKIKIELFSKLMGVCCKDPEANGSVRINSTKSVVREMIDN